MANTDQKRYKVLVVEDERALRETLCLNFELEGYQVIGCSNGKDALDIFRTHKLDLAVLDVMMPEIDGFSLCRTIRFEENHTPILFLTSKGTGADRIEGLRIGADDYLTKPFNLEELLLRVEKLIRRGDSIPAVPEMDVFEFGKCSVHFKSYQIIDKEGKMQILSKKEIMLLKLLIQKKDVVVSREEILEQVWGFDVFPSTRTIDNFISTFRKYFEDNPRQPQHFFSVRSVGYKFSA